MQDIVHRRDIRVIDRRGIAGSRGMDRPVAVGDHEVEVAHRREEIEVAVALVAPTGVVEGVERAVAVEELRRLVDDQAPQALIDLRCAGAEDPFEGDFGEVGVAEIIQRVSVAGVLEIRAVNWTSGRREYINKGDGWEL